MKIKVFKGKEYKIEEFKDLTICFSEEEIKILRSQFDLSNKKLLEKFIRHCISLYFIEH